MKTTLIPLAGLLMGLLVVTSGCKKDDPITPPPPSAPAVTFSLSSQDATLVTGQRGIKFWATPSEDVFLLKIVVTNPVGTEMPLDVQTSIPGTRTAGCQQSGYAYTRLSGVWKFKFVGSRLNGDHAGFEYQKSVEVGA